MATPFHGQLYVQAKFGALNSIAWLLEWLLVLAVALGLKQSGVLCHPKRNWLNDAQFPHEVVLVAIARPQILNNHSLIND